jgi:hypothetical protein
VTTTWSTTDNTGANAALSGGNLVVSFAPTSAGIRSADRLYSGQYYFELTFTTTNNAGVGICLGGASLTGLGSGTVGSLVYLVTNGGTVFNNGIGATALGGTTTSGWVCCIAIDATNRLVWARNGASGNWNGSTTANPATGVGGVSLAWSGGPGYGLYACASGGGGGGVVTANFGASAFVGAVPSAFASGFPSGTTIVNADVTTQIAVEHWLAASTPAQVTQVALEHWASVAAAVPSTGSPIGVVIMA